MKLSRIMVLLAIGILIVSALMVFSSVLVGKPVAQAEAKITWSIPKLSATMFPGTTSTTSITFQSSENLTNVVIESTPSLKNFVSIRPASFGSVLANQDYTVSLTLKAPPEFKKNDFGGTIHLRNAGTPPKTYAPSFDVELRTGWSSTDTGLVVRSLSYPVTWFLLKDKNGVSLSNVQADSPISQHTLQTEADFQIGIIQNTNPGRLPIEQWFDKQFSAFSNEILERASTTVGGRPAVQIQVSEIGRRVHIYVPNNTDVIEISYGAYAPVFLDIYKSIVGSIEF